MYKYESSPRTLDIVIAGPDFSGTSTQVQDAVDFFTEKGKKVRDITGTEIDALFHAELFSNINPRHLSLRDFIVDPSVSTRTKNKFLFRANDLVAGWTRPEKLLIASMVENDKTTYVNPTSADVWIMEEPPHRSGGQITRVIEHNRMAFHSTQDQVSASVNHQNYRTDEFLRFRRVLRELGKTIVRSRSEESAAYQIYDSQFLPKGMHHDEYLNLPGHRLAFANPPTNIIIACGDPNWTRQEYLDFKRKRVNGRSEDEYEKNVDYQILVNRRYASDWLETLYNSACWEYGARTPDIHRIDMTLSKKEIRKEIHNYLDSIVR